MYVDLVLRESTFALTATLPNSVTTAFGIFSASSRRRSASGFHSTVAAFTSCATCSSSSARLIARSVPGPCLPQRTVMCTVDCEIWRVYPGMGGSIANGRALPPRPVWHDGPTAEGAAPAWAGKRAEMRSEKAAKPCLAAARKGYIWWHAATSRALSSAFGLDLWFKPLAAIRGWSRVRPLRAHLFHVAQRL